MRIEAAGQNIITLGDGNQVDAKFGELGQSLAEEKLILLLKLPSADPLGLAEYQELIKDIKSSRGKIMRRLVYGVYDTHLRFFLGKTTRLEWMDAYRSLSLT